MELYTPVLALVLLAAGFAIFSLVMSAIVGPRRYNRAKLDSYECGIEPTPQPLGRWVRLGRRLCRGLGRRLGGGLPLRRLRRAARPATLQFLQAEIGVRLVPALHPFMGDAPAVEQHPVPLIRFADQRDGAVIGLRGLVEPLRLAQEVAERQLHHHQLAIGPGQILHRADGLVRPV